MKLLFKKVTGLGHLPRSEMGVLTIWAVAILVIEVLGRRATGDLHDLIAVFCVVAGVTATLAFHGKHPMHSVVWVRLRLAGVIRRLVGFLTEFGLDLIERPPIRAAWPRVLTVVCSVGLLVVAGLLLIASGLPDGLRIMATHGSYFLHLLGVAGLWVCLLGAILLSVLFPFMVLRDVLVLKRIRNGTVPEVLGLGVGGLYVAVIAFAAVLLPLWCASMLLVVSLLCLIVSLTALKTPRLSLLYRNEAGDVRRVEWQHFTILQSLSVFLPVMALVILSRGASVYDSAAPVISESMPLTSAFGVALLWTLAGSSVVWCALSAKLLFLGVRSNPARSSLTSLHVVGLGDSPLQQPVETACATAGITLADQCVETSKDTVLVQLSHADCEGPLRWCGDVPRVSAAQLQDPSVLARLVRRDDVQRRRHLMRGLEALFKHAHARSYQYGEGFWLAPHLWFVLGMSRDSAGPSGVEADGAWIEIIGPPYHRVFTRPVRHHWHRVMQSSGLSLIFVADGVRFGKVKRVLRVLMEVHDVHGGGRPVEDRDLLGIPGVRCIIHDLDLDSPFTNRHYPEPDYEDVARARVLHVYRDRVGEDEFEEAPGLCDVEPMASPDGVSVFR